MNRAVATTVACVLLSAGGALLSGVLLAAHARGTGTTGLLAAACGAEGSGCDAVISSRWGVFPPAPAAGGHTGDIGPPPPPPGGDARAGPRSGGVPVAALGLFYFSGLAVCFGALGVPGRRRRRSRALVLAVCALGCLGSAWFIYVMAVHVGAWCLFCLGSHVCNFLLLAGVVVAGSAGTAAAAGDAEAAPPPGARLVVMTAWLVLAVWVAEWAGYRALERDAAAAECDEVAAEMERFRQDEEMLRVVHLNQKQVELDIEDGDPMISNEKRVRMTLAFFSDIECPHCAEYDRFIFEEIKPLFNGHLRIVFKHRPLTSLHPNAFRAATALEAAHLQGKFWEAHDWLLERRKRLAGVDYAELAAALGLDERRFLDDMDSEAVKKRIRDDERVADRLGITATPSVFLNDRPVSKILRKYIGFWKERADSLRRTCEQSGIEW